MIPNYLKNLLDKSTQAQPIVQPRLKSRFEANSGLSNEEGFVNSFERKDDSFLENQPNSESTLLKNKNSIPENVQSVHSKEKMEMNSFENKTKFLKLTENHFHTLENKGEENKKENSEPLLSKFINVQSEIAEHSVHNSNNYIENKTFGLLNTPIKNTTKSQRPFNDKSKEILQNHEGSAVLQPSIKISIGRVEVKAVNASPKKAVKQKSKPNLKMSLEDYIDKRK